MSEGQNKEGNRENGKAKQGREQREDGEKYIETSIEKVGIE
jgi:hypothetical protein